MNRREKLELAGRFESLSNKLANVIVQIPYMRVAMELTHINVECHDGALTATPSNFAHECGSVGCAAGWCAIALEARVQRDSTGRIRHFIGIDAVDSFLGLDLERFAMENPSIWGNNAGSLVWAKQFAWDVNDAYIHFHPLIIVNKFHRVAARLRESAEPPKHKKMTYDDIKYPVSVLRAYDLRAYEV